MKPQRTNAFTLIEMLTVIAIIGILIALLFPTVQMALRKAEINQARVDVKTIAQAVQAYYNEYGILPCSSGNTITTTGPLCAGGANNLRGIIFLNPPTRKGAIASDGITIQDPWGQPYQAVYDCNYVGNIPSFDSFPTPIYAPVIIYSTGPNGVLDAYGVSSNDDIYSFQ